jgi:acyl-homoserine lactone synthase
MALNIIKGSDYRNNKILEKAYRFRHSAFVEEAGWENLRRADGLEIDQFDTQKTIHVIVESDGEVVAYSRLNPTIEPHVLSEIYPQLASRGLVQEVGAWEWSRMGTSKKARTDGRGWSGPIGLLFRCVTFAAIKFEIDTLVWQAHPVWISRASELGFNPEPMGLPLRIGGDRVVAAKMDVKLEVLQAMDFAGVQQIGELQIYL